VLLLDEPTTGLDPVAEARLIGELLASAAGKTVLLVTHQPRLTARADQVIRVEGGKIVSVALFHAALRAASAVPAI
jgi:ABC-type transport system involved in cytochrome bd biosynthesis fused ATPase/permease subunit